MNLSKDEKDLSVLQANAPEWVKKTGQLDGTNLAMLRGVSRCQKGVEFLGTKSTATNEHFESIIPTVYWGITPRGHLALSIGYEISLNDPAPYTGRIFAFLLWDFVDGGIWW